MNAVKFIRKTFLKLTSKTVPFETEDRLYKEFKKLFPNDIQKDKHGNYFVKVGESNTIFASHLDTVSMEYKDVTHVFDGDMIKTDGTTNLGADDKAGVTVMLYMIKNNVPGLYYFFVGEEVGCIGSGKLAKDKEFDFKKYNKMISFDRRGTKSVITHQSCGRSCSDEFADSLCEAFGNVGMLYEKDSGGVYTDSAEFVDVLAECTNISVGYYSEHTKNEKQDIKHLIELAKACVKIDWDNLTISRKPGEYEAKPWSYSGSGYSYELKDWDNTNIAYAYEGYEEEEEDLPWVSGGKSYYDGVDGLEELSGLSIRDGIDDQFSGVVEVMENERITYDDLKILKEQYLDMNNQNDVFFYEFLLESIEREV
jgi:hypothetical protein